MDLDARQGEFVSIVGPSGCGKTTFLKLVAGLYQPSGGTLEFDSWSSGERPRCALVFQEHGLFPWMRVVDNVAFGLEARGVARDERRRRARALIEGIGLGQFADLYPRQLSVGMRQRIGLIRALAVDPEILLMDEPFASVDALARVALCEELLRVWKERRPLVLYVTHDLEEAVLLGDRVVVLSGHPGSVLAEIAVPMPRPRSLVDPPPETGHLVADIWRLLGDQVRRDLRLGS
jgi:NitT/TauT family transport system ATP-binding protein